MTATTIQPPGLPLHASNRLQFGRESAASGGSVLWLLKRNCSLAPRQLFGFYASLCIVSLAIAGVFWHRGATLILPFTGLEVIAIGAAILMYARHAADREIIRLRPGRLTVSRVNGPRIVQVEFSPSWVRVEPEGGDRSLIELSGEGRRITVGRFVRPELRRQLADELRWALRRWHGRSVAIAPAASGTPTEEFELKWQP